MANIMITRLRRVAALAGMLSLVGQGAGTSSQMAEMLGFYGGLFEVQVHVVNSAGEPVSGATVKMALITGGSPGEHGDEAEVGHTNAQGQITKAIALQWCSLNGPANRAKLSLRIEARRDNYAPAGKEFHLDQIRIGDRYRVKADVRLTKTRRTSPSR